jgi:ADP-heptose:LPS heptosyltransferase
MFAVIASGEPNPKVPTITVLDDVRPNATVLKLAGRGKPIVLCSAEDAAKHFSEEELTKLKKQVDFEQQIVLVFAWHGSGQDRLKYTYEETYPENLLFTLYPGRTRDLRPHIKVYALRSNVKWSVK